MLKGFLGFIAISSFLATTIVRADITVPMNLTAEKGVGTLVGSVTISENKHGLLFTPNM